MRGLGGFIYYPLTRVTKERYDYYQSEGLPIGSGSVESWIKQVDARIQISGASWKAERVPQMLALRCAYLNEQLDLFSLTKG